MDKEKYNKIEQILNNIQYTRKTPPEAGSYFQLNDKYSENVDIEFGSDINRYFRIKYANELEDAACILTLYDDKVIICYDSVMNEVKIIHPFDWFYYGKNSAYKIDYTSFLPCDISDRYKYLTADSHMASVDLRISDLNKLVLKNVKVQITSTRSPIVTFHISSKLLSKTFNCHFNYNDFSYRNIDPADILSAKDIQRVEKWEYKRRKHELLTSLETLYNNNLAVFDLYDFLSDEDKLKLKLTGKL